MHTGALHFALIKGIDGKDRKCAVKLIDLSKSPGLLCEGLGWILASQAGVNVPAFAAILRVPLAELAKSMVLPKFVSGFAEYPAWCIELVDGKAVSQVHKWIFWLERAMCLGAKNTPVTAAFDYWADNRDRNYGNVIRSRDGRYVAIDHEALLHDAIWVKYYGTRFEMRSLLKEAEAQLSQAAIHKFKCDMALAARAHHSALHAIRAAGVKFVNEIFPDPKVAARLWQEIEEFLEARATVGWMSSELGVIV